MNLNENTKKMELVSPAGSHDQLIAAINAGADAVYLGYKKYSARAYAENFVFGQLKKAVRIAHENGVKVYLALNTLIKDSEIEEATYFLNDYLDLCQDGIILQDYGLIKIIKDLYPGVRMHASTQMNIHNLESVIALKELGFKRIIIAREMTLNEIGNITDNSDIEIEAFSHGSQCYSYSGSCYFSSFTGSRSGNRGRCTQPCRMKYSIIVHTDKNKQNFKGGNNRDIFIKDSYILSKSDICTVEIIPRLASSGIYALKIEGRMKAPEYVGIVTKIYRKYIDLYYDNPGDFKVEQEDVNKLRQIFSRDIGTGYFLKKYPENIISLKKSGNIGNFLGRVIKFTEKEIHIKSQSKINKGDYIEIWTNRGNEQLKVSNFEIIDKKKSGYVYKISINKKIILNTGDRIFKFYDEILDREAKSLYLNGTVKRNLEDNEFRLEQKKYSDFKLSSNRLKNYFINYSNKSENLDYINSKNRNKIVKQSSEHNNLSLTVEVYSIEDAWPLLSLNVRNIVINNIHEVFFNQKSNINKLTDLNQTAFKNNTSIIIKTPHIIHGAETNKIKKHLMELITVGFNKYSISNPGILWVILESSNKNGNVFIFLNYLMNIFNSKAVLLFKGLINNSKNAILKSVMPSPELTLEEIKKMINLSRKKADFPDKELLFSVYSYGYYPVMESRFKMHYLYKNTKIKNFDRMHYLVDRKDYKFGIVRDYNDNLIFLNSKKICNFFDLSTFYNSNIEDLYIDTRTFNESQIRDIVNYYSIAIQKIKVKRFKEFDELSMSLSNNNLFSNYTKGHLFREVM